MNKIGCGVKMLYVVIFYKFSLFFIKHRGSPSCNKEKLELEFCVNENTTFSKGVNFCLLLIYEFPSSHTGQCL